MTAIRGADNARAASAAGPLWVRHDVHDLFSVRNMFLCETCKKIIRRSGYPGPVRTEIGLISLQKAVIHRLSTMFAQDFRQWRIWPPLTKGLV
jgi:hypothetical protein